MELTAEEARVLACLVEKEATVPDSYPLTLNALRLACNQSSNRDPVVSYDDRTVEQALLSLKSMGLVRFVHPSHGGRTIRYRHVAGERWRLAPVELAVLAVLVLRGAQTVGEVRARVERRRGDDGERADGPSTVEEILDTLAARSPDPFAVRLPRRPGERDHRWAHALSGAPVDTAAAEDGRVAGSAWRDDPTPAPVREQARGTGDRPGRDLGAEVDDLRRRLEALERALGVGADADTAGDTAGEGIDGAAGTPGGDAW